MKTFMRLGLWMVIIIMLILLAGCALTNELGNEKVSSSQDQTINNNKGEQEKLTEEDQAARERDSRRVDDINAVYKALRDWFMDGKDGFQAVPQVKYDGLAAYLVPDYLDEFPQDPSRPGNYYCVFTPDGNGFYLGVWLESSDTDSWKTGLVYGEKNSALIEELLTKEMGSRPAW